MGTTSNVQALDVIRCKSIADFQEQLTFIYEHIEKNGFAVIQSWDASQNTLRDISLFFGYIKNHPNGDDSGINTLVTEHQVTEQISDSPGFREYHYGYTDELWLHTDASHIDGVGYVNGQFVRIAPPSMLLILCAKPAEKGGANFLVDVQEIFQRLWDEEPEHVKVITQPRAVSFCKAKYFSTYSPLFEELPSRRWRVRFRPDTMYVEPWAYSSVKYVVDNYFLNPKFRKHHLLTAGQILIIDNHRMMHGRDAIIAHDMNHPRTLHKTWIWDDSTDNLLRLMDEPPDIKQFQAFNVYHPKNLEAGHKRVRSLELGIKLQSKTL
ncbi:MAG: TauD/TfdA family dioxygenase [Scytonema sp. PMC 1069.18]|nr:TauD/TfdA family dioxygenase [Scytonema sp. PMC 1069.18]MEC4885336.1 TauD/TfdA family dioxygenase [Scytonema sp. PMC 1070.18]